MDFNTLDYRVADQVAYITINRPNKLNALNRETIAELHEAFDGADMDEDVRVIILTGSGEKAFVAGADISEFANFSVEQGRMLSAEGQNLLFDFIQNLSTPVIAAVNGFALGGGLELAMSCHIRLASSNAKMGLPEVSLGLIPGYGGTQRLAQLVGRGRALELILTAGMIDAEQAKSYGLVNHVSEPADLIGHAEKIAAKIKKNSPMAISEAIKAVNANFDPSVNGYQSEIAAFGRCFGTEDFKEGTSAFLEKRKADFQGN